MAIYALSQRSEETHDAAGKAMQDVFAVLAKNHAKTIWSIPKSYPKYLKIVDLPYLAVFLLFKAKKKDFLFFSIPENHTKIKLLKVLQKLKKYHIICFINDLNAFRYGNAANPIVQQKMQKEAALIGLADFVLMPNENTRELLEKNGVQSNLIPVGVWDYLMTEQQKQQLNQLRKEQEEKEKPKMTETPVKIAFAGNLNKSEFLMHMNFLEKKGDLENAVCRESKLAHLEHAVWKEMNLQLHLWGKLEESKQKALPNICLYHGVLKADKVPEAICTMDYGLVWDGSGEDAIEGGLGEYLKYNNSHKCGLYLASGVPAIVWEHAGMAHFIKKYECGITIERLSDLPKKIQEADYETLKKNAMDISQKLQNGYYLDTALKKALGE